MPKPRIISNKVEIPSNVEITVKSRKVVVKGPRGTLSKDFTHIDADMYLVNEKAEGSDKTKQFLKVSVEFSAWVCCIQ